MGEDCPLPFMLSTLKPIPPAIARVVHEYRIVFTLRVNPLEHFTLVVSFHLGVTRLTVIATGTPGIVVTGLAVEELHFATNFFFRHRSVDLFPFVSVDWFLSAIPNGEVTVGFETLGLPTGIASLLDVFAADSAAHVFLIKVNSDFNENM